ncbi:unnamed protein product [Enterobius vermicularis]|uniref:Ovule protein n=1 Tax=Enterobius vermicularis TaxID=51028 RepID=A0A0N4VMC9_ENTVE|nr:unnamed protein product [Enterobius vermicularis]
MPSEGNPPPQFPHSSFSSVSIANTMVGVLLLPPAQSPFLSQFGSSSSPDYILSLNQARANQDPMALCIGMLEVRGNSENVKAEEFKRGNSLKLL